MYFKRWVAALVAILIVGVGSYLHTHYMLVRPSDGTAWTSFKTRDDVAAELRVKFTAAEERAAGKMIMELDALRDEFLKRFDDKFLPDHESPHKSAARDAKYYWDLVLTFNPERSANAYDEAIKQRLYNQVASPDVLRDRISEILIQTSNEIFQENIGLSPGLALKAILASSNLNSAARGNSWVMQGSLNASAAYTVRAATYDVLSRLTKYYVSTNDVVRISGSLPFGELCKTRIDLCKAALSSTNGVVREGLKKAGIGIASTAVKAAGIANVVGLVVLTYQAYEMYDRYSKNLIKDVAAMRKNFELNLDSLFASYCEFDGEYRQQLRSIADTLIEEQTKPWSFGI